MSNVIFEQWYEDMYGEKTFPNISDEHNFKEACRNAYLFGLESKWNYNISEAPKDGTECLFIVKDEFIDNYIKRMRFGCIDKLSDFYSEISLDEERRCCISCKHSKDLLITKDEDDYERINLEYSKNCKGCNSYQFSHVMLETDEFLEALNVSNKFPKLFESRFNTEEEVNKAKKEFLDKYGVWYYDGSYDDCDQIGVDSSELVAWKLVETIPEHLKR
jgi:hypothetical protein